MDTISIKSKYTACSYMLLFSQQIIVNFKAFTTDIYGCHSQRYEALTGDTEGRYSRLHEMFSYMTNSLNYTDCILLP